MKGHTHWIIVIVVTLLTIRYVGKLLNTLFLNETFMLLYVWFTSNLLAVMVGIGVGCLVYKFLKKEQSS